MTEFIIKKLPYDQTANGGLALVGQYLKRLEISKVFGHKFPVGVGGISNNDILKSYLGLLVQGKNDFEAIEEFRGDAFFTHAPSRFKLAGQFNLAQLLDHYATGPVDCDALRPGWVLGLGAHDNAHTEFERLYRHLTPQRKPKAAFG